MRKLASIQRIAELNPIPGADMIVVASILGWKVVVKKGEFRVGDLCVYCEIDSCLPKKPEFEFLRQAKFRIKTKRLKGQISQGIAFPLSILSSDIIPEEGLDVTDCLGVIKYEPPEDLMLDGDKAGCFPGYVPKTDEMRIQSSPELLKELRGKVCYVTTKCDGTSMSIVKTDGTTFCCSRNWAMRDMPHSLQWKIARKYNVDRLPEGFAVQGELCGPKIAGNKLNLPSFDLFVFNVYDIPKSEYLSYADFVEFCNEYQLRTVPIVDDNFLFNHTIDELLELARGKYEGTKNDREGIVIRPLIECHSPTLCGRLSVKVINNEFLVKGGD